MANSKTLIRGGLLVDGSGTAPRPMDIMVEGGRIAALASELPPSSDAEVVDASGKVVAPGFIDLHSHADFSLLAFPDANSAVMQGITTIAPGNCGGGVAPIDDESVLRKVAFAYDPTWEVDVNWKSFGEYASHLDGTAINVAPLVAHGPIRNMVMGMEARQPSATELTAMKDLLKRCLDEGAFGLSTGLEYEPGKWAQSSEVEALVAVVGEVGGLYATHMRNRADEHATATAEAMSAAKHGEARLQLSHFAPRPNAPAEVADEAFRLVEEAIDLGEPVGVDTFPEIWGPALLIDLFPEWALKGSPEEVIQKLTDQDVRSEISKHFVNADSFLAKAAGYEQIFIADAPGTPELKGRSLTDIAGSDDVGLTATDILLDADLDFRSVAIRHLYATESDLRRVIAMPNCSFESDGVVTDGEDDMCPLLWNASSYGYTTRVIEHYVKQESLLTLPDAVRKMTSLPAASLGLSNRGTIRPGAAADIVVFAPENIHDRTTPDLPARHPSGIDLVMVNGAIALRDGLHQATRSGRLLER